jgi:hypothetical protein
MLREGFLPDDGPTLWGLAKARGVSPQTVDELLRAFDLPVQRALRRLQGVFGDPRARRITRVRLAASPAGRQAGRFLSRVLPLFRRRPEQVGELLPRPSRHGLALGDLDVALGGLLGGGAPLSRASL